MRKRAEIEAYRPDMDRTPQHVYEEWVRNATLFEILLDIRDQNERIIELLSRTRQHTHITDALTRKQITVESPDGT